MTHERYHTAMSAAEEATRASDEAVARVQQRLGANQHVEGYDPRALGGIPDPVAGATERVLKRLNRAPEARPSRLEPRIGLAVAAVAGVVLAVILTVHWLPDTQGSGELPPSADAGTATPVPAERAHSEGSVQTPDPRPEPVDSGALQASTEDSQIPPSSRIPAETAADELPLDAPQDAALADLGREPPSAPTEATRFLDSVHKTDLTAHEGVALSYLGAGALAGTASAPVIRWESGELDVEVEPGRGTQLVVTTDEARIAVIGTGFRVVRDGTTTEVLVFHGRVSVTCEHGEVRVLGTDETIRCWPAGPAVALQRARELQSQGRMEEALDVAVGADRGDDAIAAEILFVRLELLTALERHDEALRVGERYLTLTDPPRRAEAEQILLSIRQR